MTSLPSVPEHKSTRPAEHSRRPSTAQTNPRLNARPSSQSRVGNYNLAFSGRGKAALAFHLGVCIRLSETGLLSKFDVIFAEDLGIILAALLRCHWRTVCSDSTPAGSHEHSKSYRYLLAAPPSPLFETSQEHKDVLRAMQAGAASVGLEASTAATTEIKEDSPAVRQTVSDVASVASIKKPTAVATVAPATISAPHQTVTNSKSLFTQKITEPMMDLILNVGLGSHSDEFTEWMTRCSLSLDSFAEDDKQDEYQRRCSIRLLKRVGPKPLCMQMTYPGCFGKSEEQMMMGVLPAILWGKPFTSKKLPAFSSIWHAILDYAVSVQRNFRQQTTFITSLAGIARGPARTSFQEPVPQQMAESISKESHKLMQNLLNSNLTTSADCECGTEDVTKHMHCLADLLRHDFIQLRFLVIETLQGCPITGSKLSTTVSPDNRLVVSPARTPAAPHMGPQSHSNVTVSSFRLPTPEQLAGRRESEPVMGLVASATSSSNGSDATTRTAPRETSDWPQAVMLRIEGALMDAGGGIGEAIISHALVGSCLNWGYRQSADYIHKMLQHSPKLSSLNLTDRKPVLPISLQSSIRMLMRRSLNDQNTPTSLPELSTKAVCKCLCCCACTHD